MPLNGLVRIMYPCVLEVVDMLLIRTSLVVKGGIVIDVSDMQKVHLNKKKAIATVQTGIHVGPLVKGLARKGFMAPFGDSPTVGIGGITMGGGLECSHDRLVL